MDLGLQSLKVLQRNGELTDEDQAAHALFAILSTDMEIAEVQAELRTLSNLMTSVENINDLKRIIGAHGIEQSLVTMFANDPSFCAIAPSIKTGDADAVIAELNIATEGVLDSIKTLIKNITIKIRTKATDWFRSIDGVRNTLRKECARIENAEIDFAKLANTRIAGIDIKYLEPTLEAIEKLLASPVVYPTPTKGSLTMVRDYGNELNENAKANGTANTPADVLISWDNNRHLYVIKPQGKLATMTAASFGISERADLNKFCAALLDTRISTLLDAVDDAFDKMLTLVDEIGADLGSSTTTTTSTDSDGFPTVATTTVDNAQLSKLVALVEDAVMSALDVCYTPIKAYCVMAYNIMLHTR